VLAGRETRVPVFDADGGLTADTEAVLEIVRDRGLVLATGHLAPDEVEQLSERASQMGVRKIVATHPDLPVISMPVALQKRLAERGVFFERTFNVTRRADAGLPMAGLAARIREVGVETTILATDFGQTDNPTPVAGMLAYVQGLLEHGFSREEVRRLAADHARGLLDV
jgi:hypothetical protein